MSQNLSQTLTGLDQDQDDALASGIRWGFVCKSKWPWERTAMARHRRRARDAEMVARCHDMQLLLCDELEALADSLPSGVDRQRCLHLARAVYPLVASSHEIEETLLFDPLSSFHGSMPDMPLTLERLRYEHHSDLCFAEELNDVLLTFGRGEGLMTADAIGYMLRAFFESVRRHVAFEKEILLPLLALVHPSSHAS